MALSPSKPKAAKAKPGAKKGKVEDAGPVVRSKKAQAEYDRPFTAIPPVVNLLSPELQDLIEQARLKRMFGLLSIGLIFSIGAGWGLQTGFINAAQNRLDAEQAISTKLAAEQAALAPIQSFYGQIEANTATIQGTMAKEVLTSQIISAVEATIPSGVTLDSLSLSLSGGGSAAGAATDPTVTTSTCPSQDPYSNRVASAGCVNVSGSAVNRAALGDWLDNVQNNDLFTVAFIPSTTADPDKGVVTFAGTIGLDAEMVYQNRYADPEFLKAGGN